MNIGESNVEDVKQQVGRYIEQTGRRVVVLIDDIDRTDASELLGVFRTVRLTAEFKKTTFVLAYDEGEVRAHLRKLGISREYLEKIVQNPVQLPAIDQGDIDRFLLYSDAGRRSQLDVLFDKIEIDQQSRAEFDKRIVELYPSHVRPFFQTLRSAKRFLNALGARLPAVKHEVYLLDFVLLEVLRLFAPGVYQDIYENSHYYIPEWTWETIRSSPFGIVGRSEKDETAKKIKQHIDELLGQEPRREDIREILEELFPARIKSALGGALPTHSDSYAEKARAKKRLTHPESFQKYFLLTVPRGLIPDKAIEDTFKSWASVDDPSALIQTDLGAYQKRGDLRKFLDSVVLFLDNINDRSVDPLLTFVGRNIQMFSQEGRETSEYDGAFKLVLFLLNDKVKDGDKRRRLEQTLRETPFLEFAIKIVNALAGSQVGLYALQQATDLPAAKQIVSDRLRKEVIEAGVDLFKTNAQYGGYVLFQTGTYSDESRQMVNDYALQLCKRNPPDIGKLVGGFFLDFGPTSSFNLKDLRRVYNSQAVAELARAAGEKAWGTDNERRAIQQLLAAEPDSATSTAEP
jgi:hypothetical protein